MKDQKDKLDKKFLICSCLWRKQYLKNNKTHKVIKHSSNKEMQFLEWNSPPSFRKPSDILEPRIKSNKNPIDTAFE